MKGHVILKVDEILESLRERVILNLNEILGFLNEQVILRLNEVTDSLREREKTISLEIRVEVYYFLLSWTHSNF